jgi:hypothetical protein
VVSDSPRVGARRSAAGVAGVVVRVVDGVEAVAGAAGVGRASVALVGRITGCGVDDR